MDPPLAQGVKRKAALDHDRCSKKPCVTQSDPAEKSLLWGAVGLEYVSPCTDLQDLNINSAEDSSSGSEAGTTSNTPLTPLSSTASPRFPSELKTHHCTYKDCGKAFNRPAKLAQHILSHTNTRPFICPYRPCTKDFLRQSHLQHHVQSAHSDVRDYVCESEGCGKTFITATRLKRHHAAHEGRLKFQCTVTGCGQTFRKQGTLQKHTITVHEGRKPFSCDVEDLSGRICGQEFDTAGKLRTHEGRVHGGQRFWCSICNANTSGKNTTDSHMPSEGVAGFSTYSQLQEHIKTIHPPECRVCGMVCSSQRELKSHVEVRHGTLSVEDRKSFVCQEPGCRRAFTKKGNLNVHIESTHKAKKYVCGEVPPKSLNNVEGWDGVNACGRALSTKGSLQNHIRTTHLGMGRRRRKPAGKSRDDSSNDHSNTSNLMKLTGAGYDDDSRRHIDCLFPQCNFRFVRDYDLQIHLLSRHGLTEADAETFVTGTKGEIGPMSASSSAFPEDLMQEIISKNQDAVDIQGHEDIDDALFTGEGRFWIGDGLHDTDARGDDEWVRDEREMRAVIEDGTGAHEQDETMIDPILL